MSTPRAIAVDWSGAVRGSRRKIWLAEITAGAVVRLEDGRDRAQLEAHLLDAAMRGPNVIIGLDFAFSMPAWFMREHSFASAHDLWAYLASDRDEAWLRACEPPFWGRPGKQRPPADPARPPARRCEAATGAKSVFQAGGAGAVGTGSLRGMPMLHRLHAAGMHIWPYDDPGYPLVIEIYPRLLTGPVRKSSPQARARYIDTWLAQPHGVTPTQNARAEQPTPPIPTQHAKRGEQPPSAVPPLPTRANVTVSPAQLDHARNSEDAFDALFSAIAMWRHIDNLRDLPKIEDPLTRLEGTIWQPPPSTSDLECKPLSADR